MNIGAIPDRLKLVLRWIATPFAVAATYIATVSFLSLWVMFTAWYVGSNSGVWLWIADNLGIPGFGAASMVAAGSLCAPSHKKEVRIVIITICLLLISFLVLQKIFINDMRLVPTYIAQAVGLFLGKAFYEQMIEKR